MKNRRFGAMPFMAGKKKGNKYNNQEYKYDGKNFSSKLEMQRYIFLRGAEEQGEIEDLETQKSFLLLPKQTKKVIVHMKTKDKEIDKFLFHPCTYVADFVYKHNGNTIVEDTKGSAIIIDQKFPLKQKMMYFFHGLYVHTIYKATTPIPEE